MLNSASSSKLILCEASKNDDSERNYDARATALMKQVIAEYLGHEMTMITLDIPPGGGSAPHRHPGHHTFGYVLEGRLQDQARQRSRKDADERPDLLRGAGPASRGVAQWERY
jgi:quercetin dioxygenase-like cupin family protein